MTVALGIDASWKHDGTSGIALLRAETARTTCLLSDITHGIAAADLIELSRRLAGAPPDVVAIDMPLAVGPIAARRAADNAICTAFAAAHASVHDPALMQPGLADRIRTEFAAAGYPLAVTGHTEVPALLETYPHPIMMQLCRSPRRVPYKVGKTRSYWPDQNAAGRRARLRASWQQIHTALAACMVLERPNLDYVFTLSFAAMKPFEDRLDAIACALAGLAYARGDAIPYGDTFAAIWLPRGCDTYRVWAA